MTDTQRQLLAALVAEYLEPDYPSGGWTPAYVSPLDVADHLDGAGYEYADDFEALADGGYIGTVWTWPEEEKNYASASWSMWPTAKGMYAVWGPR